MGHPGPSVARAGGPVPPGSPCAGGWPRGWLGLAMRKTPGLARDFSGRLRHLRHESGLTQDKLAERSGLSRDAISRIECGTRHPSLKTIGMLAQGLRVSQADFFVSVEAAPPAADRHTERMSRMDSYLRSVDDETAEQLLDVVDAAYKLARGAAAGPAGVAKGGRPAGTGRRPK